MQHFTFSIKNVKAETTVMKFVQTVFRYVKAAQIDSIFQQLIQVWIKLNSKLCQDISKSIEKITISEFLQLLQTKKNVWKNIVLQIEKINCQQHQNMQNMQNQQELVYRSQRARESYYRILYQSALQQQYQHQQLLLNFSDFTWQNQEK